MNTRTDALTERSAPTHLHDGSYADWPAILLGGVVAAGFVSVFSTFGAAIGFASISPGDGDTGPSTGALIAIATWIVWTAVSSVMAGSYVAGRMRRRIDPSSTTDAVSVRDGIHGLGVWGVAVILGAWVLGGTVSTVATTAGQAAPAMTQAMSAAPAQTTTQAAGTTAQADGTQAAGTTAAPAADAAPQMTDAEKEAAAKKAKAYSVLSAFATAASLLIAAAGGYWAAGMGGRHRDENRVFARFGTWN